MEDLEQALADDMQNEKEGFDSFDTAISRKPIELTLKSIQRRQAYIDQLGKPLEWIDRGSEELLFLTRRATLDEHMQDLAGGIDMEKHVRVINAALKQYLPTADKLAIRLDDAALTPLKEIWYRVSQREPQENSSRSESVRRAIELAICNGDASRVSELKQLTVESAKCLSKMPGSALLLNGLEGMSPVAATHLLQWSGDWICMNGIETLNPPLAKALFEWEGEWISLNGVTEFPARVARFLLGWKGKQLELMGLRQLPGQTAMQYLADWEAAGGRLFVPEIVREKLEHLHRSTPVHAAGWNLLDSSQ
jgi:hypothetical protein